MKKNSFLNNLYLILIILGLILLMVIGKLITNTALIFLIGIPILSFILGIITRIHEGKYIVNFIIYSLTFCAGLIFYDFSSIGLITVYFVVSGISYVLTSVFLNIADEED